MGFNDIDIKVSGGSDIISTLQTYTTKILKPNIVDGKNVLTQQMVSAKNTKYVIKYDYELEEDITVPEGCILEFDGGSISGAYTVTGTNTGIKAGLVKIFGTDVTLAGSWNVAEAYPEWFGAKGDSVTDDTEYIQKTIDTFDAINLTNNYKIDFLTVGEGKTIKSNTLNTIYTSGGVVLGERCCVLAPNMTIKSIATEGIDILRVGTKNTVILYAIIGNQPSSTQYGSNTTDNGLVCEYIIFSKIRLHRIQYCNHGIQLKAGSQQKGDTLNKVEIDVTWIADCLYGIYQDSTGSSEQTQLNVYIEYCNVGWHSRDMFMGVHRIHFDDVNTWFEVPNNAVLALGELYLSSIRYNTFLEKTDNVTFLETKVWLKDGYWVRPLRAASGSAMPTSKRVDGLCIYRTDVKKPVWWDNATQKWLGADGQYYNNSTAGSTQDRPTDIKIGTSYFDTTLGKPIWYKGPNTWVDATGATV